MTIAEETNEILDPEERALLLNDMRGLSKPAIGRLVARLAERMDVDRALAPIDILTDKDTGRISLYINARGAAELAKRYDLSDESLVIDIRESPAVVIATLTMSNPATGRKRTDTGAASYKADWPKSLADAIKKASTSAHRRVTLGMVGIFLDEPPTVPDGLDG